jgi:hypothetical protein
MAHDQAGDAYCVYNASLSTVNLRVPPLPVTDSRAAGQDKIRRAEGWDVAVKAVAGTTSGTVYCGMTLGVEGITYYPLRPGFLRPGIAVIDPINSRLHAHAMVHGDDCNGACFELVCFNETGSLSTVSLQIKMSDAVPAGFASVLYDPEQNLKTIHAGEGRYAIDLPGTGSKRMYLIAGTQAFINDFTLSHPALSAGLIAVSPNPFSNHAVIRYSLPYTTLNEISFGIYTLQGRMVWSEKSRNVFCPGMHSLLWNGHGNNGVKVSAGVYLFRMTVIRSGQSSPAIFEQRLIRLP